MEPQLLYDIACQQNADAIRRAEQASLTAALTSGDHGVRRWLAAVLVTIASQLQPGLHCEIPKRAQPATA